MYTFNIYYCEKNNLKFFFWSAIFCVAACRLFLTFVQITNCHHRCLRPVIFIIS